MKSHFKPEEVLFSPTSRCTLSCSHCQVRRSRKELSIAAAKKFLSDCAKHGIRRVGFTGGEPFLAMEFLLKLSEEAVELGMVFDRLMTNGVWWRTAPELEKKLHLLKRSGFDGTICVSADAFHGRYAAKIARFIKTAAKTWNRPDMIEIAYVEGLRDKDTKALLKKIAGNLKGSGLAVRFISVPLSPVGRAAGLIDPWDGKWFKEDLCKGPGNVLYVLPDGAVKPCCGYATDHDELTIGNIKKDGYLDIIRNAKRNRFVSTVFGCGLSYIRRELQKRGVKFPGKTSNHCFFCDYLLRGGFLSRLFGYR